MHNFVTYPVQQASPEEKNVLALGESTSPHDFTAKVTKKSSFACPKSRYVLVARGFRKRFFVLTQFSQGVPDCGCMGIRSIAVTFAVECVGKFVLTDSCAIANTRFAILGLSFFNFCSSRFSIFFFCLSFSLSLPFSVIPSR